MNLKHCRLPDVHVSVSVSIESQHQKPTQHSRTIQKTEYATFNKLKGQNCRTENLPLIIVITGFKPVITIISGNC